MSVQALSWVLDNSKAEHAARLVLISIANHADKLGNQSWPSVATIAEESRLSHRAVQCAIKELQKIKELIVVPGGADRGRYLFSLLGMQNLHPAESAPPQILSSTPAESVGPIRKNRPEPSLDIEEEIYKLYPRKIAKADAVRAITKAIIRLQQGEGGHRGVVSHVWLKEKVVKFAASPAGQAGKFTPHPATWFNRSSYLDDEKEWNRLEGKSNGKAKQATGALHNSSELDYTEGADHVYRG